MIFSDEPMPVVGSTLVRNGSARTVVDVCYRFDGEPRVWWRYADEDGGAPVVWPLPVWRHWARLAERRG